MNETLVIVYFVIWLQSPAAASSSFEERIRHSRSVGIGP